MPKVEWLTGPFDAVIGTNFLPPATASEGAVLVVHDLAFERFPLTAPQIDARWHRRFDRWFHGRFDWRLNRWRQRRPQGLTNTGPKTWKDQERHLGKRMLARAKPMTLFGGSFSCP